MFVTTSCSLFKSTCRRRRAAALQMWFVTDFHWAKRCRPCCCQTVAMRRQSRSMPKPLPTWLFKTTPPSCERAAPAFSRASTAIERHSVSTCRPGYSVTKSASWLGAAGTWSWRTASRATPATEAACEPAHGVGEQRREPRPRRRRRARRLLCF